MALLMLVLGSGFFSTLSAQSNPFLQGSKPPADQTGGDAAGTPGENGAVIQAGIPMPAFLVDLQRSLHQTLSDATKRIKTESGDYDIGAVVVVLLAAFAYGVFHALGPGHGKALVATLFVSRPARIRQSISLGYLIALIHAVVAIAVVLIILYLIQAVFLASFDQASHWTSVLSYGLVALLGLFMFAGALVETISGGRRHLHFHVHLPHWLPGAAAARHSHTHDHDSRGHVHDRNHTHHAHDHDHSHHHGPHDHDHDEHPSSGTHSLESPAADNRASPVKGSEIFATALASSIVPCPGAATIMVFAVSLGLPFIGALAVVSLSVGMGITTSLVGVLAILAQRGILKSASLGGAKLARIAASVLRVLGTAAIFVLGLVLLLGQLV